MNDVFKVLQEPKKTPFDFSLKLIRIQFCIKISSWIFLCPFTIHNPLVLHGEKDLMIHVLILQLDLQEVFSRFMVSMTGFQESILHETQYHWLENLFPYDEAAILRYSKVF